MPNIEVNGTCLHYLQIECKQSTCAEHLVMIHGLAATMAFWYLQHAENYAKKFNVILYDLRGHGRSKKTDNGYSPQNLAEDLKLLLDNLELEKVHLVAHSLGGVVAMNFACRHPERVLSLVIADTQISLVRNSGVLKHWQYGKKIQQLNKYGFNIDITDPFFGHKLLAELAVMPREKSLAVPDDLKKLIAPIIGNFSNRSSKQFTKLLRTTSAEKEIKSDDDLSLKRLENLKCPILALYGEYSVAMFTGMALLDIWPHAWFWNIRQAGHFFPSTRPNEFISICQEFWKQKGKPPSERPGSNKAFFRSDRFHQVDDKWFFFSREGKHGPFLSEDLAKHALFDYLQEVNFVGNA